jgi:hypothetical protein
MTDDASHDHLLGTIETALSLLRDYRADPGDTDDPAAPLPSLLRQCEELSAGITPPPIRTLHHLACSGGTMISKCVAALPNAILLSEIDPLSRMRVDHPDTFAPTDLLVALRRSLRPVPDRVLSTVFQASLAALHREMTELGQVLVLRDHAHSQFCTEQQADSRPTLHELVTGILPTRSVVTLRHPLDAFLSLGHRGWTHFDPFTLEDYALRVSAFLDRHAQVPVILYEDFTADPDSALREICAHLDLPYSPLITDLAPVFRLSGDSGRSGDVITPRTRRPISEDVAAQRDSSPTYAGLCARFGYAP